MKLPNEDAYLINKEQTVQVGNGSRVERWTIEYRPGDSFSANVLYDGGAGGAAFLSCDDQGLSSDGMNLVFDCQVFTPGDADWTPVGIVEQTAEFYGVGDVVSVPGAFAMGLPHDDACELHRRRINDITLKRWKACLDRMMPSRDDAEFARLGIEAYILCQSEAVAKQRSLSAQTRDGGCFTPVHEAPWEADAIGLIRAAAEADKRYTTLPKIVFVTVQIYDGNLGGLEGADEKCQEEAAASLLPGTYKAWLAVGGSDASVRHSNGGNGYVLVDGTPVARELSDLRNGTLTNAISLDRLRNSVPGQNAWTGVGSNESQRCDGFTSNDAADEGVVGDTSGTNDTWQSLGAGSCSASARLYCIEQ